MLWYRFLLLVGLIAKSATAYDVVDAIIEPPQSLVHAASYPGGLKLQVYAPDKQTSFPVIWFLSGFGADSPVGLYSKLLKLVVSKGYIVAGLYHELPKMPNYLRDGKVLYNIMEWGKVGLAERMQEQKFSAVPDVAGRSVVMAQSAGNHIVGQALTDGCSVAKAFVMIDPVDGLDPYRIITSEDLIKPGEKVNFTIPALLLDNGLDPTSTSKLSPPCAPANISNDHFYNAWRGPIWNINATAYGHIDCTDDPSEARLICPTNKSTDKDLYREMLAEATTIFLDVLFGGNPEQLSLLEDPSHWKVDVVLKHDLKGKSHSEIKPGCISDAEQSAVFV